MFEFDSVASSLFLVCRFFSLLFCVLFYKYVAKNRTVVWNTLPEDITTSQSLSAFCQRLKTWLFRKSYPDIII